MTKKQLTNIQLFLNKSDSNFTTNIYSELNYNALLSILHSGKMSVRNSKIKRSLSRWSFTSTFPNGGFFKRKIKSKKIININLFSLLSKKNNFFLNKKSFYSLNKPYSYNLYKNIPRNILIFLINNQSDFFLEKEKSALKHLDFFKSTILLKKKSPAKIALLNYFYFIKTFEMIYSFFFFKKNIKQNKQKFKKTIFFNKSVTLLLLLSI